MSLFRPSLEVAHTHIHTVHASQSVIKRRRRTDVWSFPHPGSARSKIIMGSDQRGDAGILIQNYNLLHLPLSVIKLDT